MKSSDITTRVVVDSRGVIGHTEKGIGSDGAVSGGGRGVTGEFDDFRDVEREY